jgi:hypothetical protein
MEIGNDHDKYFKNKKKPKKKEEKADFDVPGQSSDSSEEISVDVDITGTYDGYGPDLNRLVKNHNIEGHIDNIINSHEEDDLEEELEASFEDSFGL